MYDSYIVKNTMLQIKSIFLLYSSIAGLFLDDCEISFVAESTENKFLHFYSFNGQKNFVSNLKCISFLSH